MKLATIGYQSATLDAVIQRLKTAGVEVLIDVRAIAASRRPGFSKGVLSASLTEAGIEYLHLRQLGTPKAGRDAARSGRTAEMRAIFADHLSEPGAQLELAQATGIAGARKVALLCFEADHGACHRAILADRICEVIDCEIEPL